jgi:hypothetical protein
VGARVRARPLCPRSGRQRPRAAPLLGSAAWTSAPSHSRISLLAAGEAHLVTRADEPRWLASMR